MFNSIKDAFKIAVKDTCGINTTLVNNSIKKDDKRITKIKEIKDAKKIMDKLSGKDYKKYY